MYEDSYISPSLLTGNYSGVIVLGGAILTGNAKNLRPQIHINSRVERLTSAVVLMRNNPSYTLIHTGLSQHYDVSNGIKTFVGDSQSEHFYRSLGVSNDRVIYEKTSINTYQNALFSSNILQERIYEPWLLVTSASHMPRAMAVFEKIGWNVTAYPVDYRSAHAVEPFSFSLIKGVELYYVIIYESLAWVKYSLNGWI